MIPDSWKSYLTAVFSLGLSGDVLQNEVVSRPMDPSTIQLDLNSLNKITTVTSCHRESLLSYIKILNLLFVCFWSASLLTLMSVCYFVSVGWTVGWPVTISGKSRAFQLSQQSTCSVLKKNNCWKGPLYVYG